MWMLRALSIIRARPPHSLNKKKREERKKNAHHLMPQCAPGMGQPLAKAPPGAFALRGHHAPLRQILRSLLARSLVHPPAQMFRHLPRAASELASKMYVSHNRKSVAVPNQRGAISAWRFAVAEKRQ